jgi:signal peptidase I
LLLRLILGLSVLLLVLVFGFLSIFGLYSAQADSMRPTLEPGQRFTVEKTAYGFSNLSLPFGIGFALEPDNGFRWGGRVPERGDLVVYLANDLTHISRVIGLPGDRIALEGGAILINDEPVERTLIGDHEYRSLSGALQSGQVFRERLLDGPEIDVLEIRDSFGDDRPVTRVPPGHVFLISDNRDMATDSRIPYPHGPGAVPIHSLVGRIRLD